MMSTSPPPANVPTIDIIAAILAQAYLGPSNSNNDPKEAVPIFLKIRAALEEHEHKPPKSHGKG